jgi:hypothetical protein
MEEDIDGPTKYELEPTRHVDVTRYTEEPVRRLRGWDERMVMLTESRQMTFREKLPTRTQPHEKWTMTLDMEPLTTTRKTQV